MRNTLRFAVLGSGNGARAFCGQIANKGYPVIMYEPLEATQDYLRIKVEKEMFLDGDIVAGGKIEAVTMQIEEAVESADVIIVVVPSFAHKPIFKKLIPKLKDEQHIVIVPGNYGGLLMKKMMHDNGAKRRITISETSTLPYACRISSYNRVMIYKKKLQMKIATCPAVNNGDIIDIMNDVFHGETIFISARNLLETDLDNVNETLHPLPVLLNYGTIEKNPDTFRHYMDGITPLIDEKMMQMDEERLALGRKISLDLIPTLDQLKMYYGDNDSNTYYEYVNSPESPYKDIVGHNVRSRYITEDVPHLHVPAVQIGDLVGVEMRLSKLCIELSSLLHDTDYFSEGTTLEKLGISGMTPEEIVKIVS